MKKIYLLFLLSLLMGVSNTKATTVVIIESSSLGHVMDQNWLAVCTGLGYSAAIYPQTKLDSTNWFASTDVLVVASGVIPITSTGISTIQSFLLQGGRVFLQTEYQSTFGAIIAWQQIVNACGGSFTWLGTTAGTLNPMAVSGSLSNTPNATTPIANFWYGDNAIPGCNSHIEPFLSYGNSYYGFIFCVPSNNSRMITTSDQDWVISNSYVPLMQNIMINLASPTYACVLSAGSLSVNLGPDTAICNGQSATLRGTTAGATSYLWSTGATTDTITVNTSGTYWVQVSNGGSCTATDTIVISAGSTFTITAGADTSVCAGTPLQLNASYSAGATYTWTGPQNFNTQSPLIPATTSADSGTYTVVANVGGCISQPVTTHVAISPAPSAPTATSNSPICEGDTLALSASTIAGANYAWTGPDSSNTQNAVIMHATMADSGTYTVLATVGNCSSAAQTIQVVINPAPIAAITASDTVICATDSVLLCATGTYSSYNWNNGKTTSCIYVKGAGNYYATVTSSNGCTAQSNRIGITVNPVPPVSITINGDTLTCNTPGTYQWFLNGNLIPAATGAVYIAQQKGLYTVMVTGTNGCSSVGSAVQITGIAQIAGTDFNVYPSPVAGQLTVQLGSNIHEALEVEIFDAIGQRVKQSMAEGEKTQINVSDLATGVYLIKIGNSVRKFLKE